VSPRGVDANSVADAASAELAIPVFFAGPGYDPLEPLPEFCGSYEPVVRALSALLGRNLSPWLDWDMKRSGG